MPKDICISISANVAVVSDMSHILKGAIRVGDVITGSYIYSTAATDTNRLPTVGDYWHTTAPYGIFLTVNNMTFNSHPSNPEFLFELVNNHGYSPRDNYLLRSYQNVFALEVPASSSYPSGLFNPDNHISWQLDDASATALRNTQIPRRPPDLGKWTSIFGLSIHSRNSEGQDFFIRAHVTSAELCR